jgi:hypothetical protein
MKSTSWVKSGKVYRAKKVAPLRKEAFIALIGISPVKADKMGPARLWRCFETSSNQDGRLSKGVDLNWKAQGYLHFHRCESIAVFSYFGGITEITVH